MTGFTKIARSTFLCMMVYDQQGKAVKSGVITAEETEIDLSNLSEGVYLFKAGTEMLETFKIIKQ